jgi:hypothetical protein
MFCLVNQPFSTIFGSTLTAAEAPPSVLAIDFSSSSVFFFASSDRFLELAPLFFDALDFLEPVVSYRL